VLGFSSDQKSPMDILGTATNRKLIETLLREVSGKDWTLKLTVRENLLSKPQPSTETPSENYADDPLIREALEAAGIPAVINGAGSVFGTETARDWLRLLEALERGGYGLEELQVDRRRFPRRPKQ